LLILAVRQFSFNCTSICQSLAVSTGTSTPTLSPEAPTGAISAVKAEIEWVNRTEKGEDSLHFSIFLYYIPIAVHGLRDRLLAQIVAQFQTAVGQDRSVCHTDTGLVERPAQPGGKRAQCPQPIVAGAAGLQTGNEAGLVLDDQGGDCCIL